MLALAELVLRLTHTHAPCLPAVLISLLREVPTGPREGVDLSELVQLQSLWLLIQADRKHWHCQFRGTGAIDLAWALQSHL